MDPCAKCGRVAPNAGCPFCRTHRRDRRPIDPWFDVAWSWVTGVLVAITVTYFGLRVLGVVFP